MIACGVLVFSLTKRGFSPRIGKMAIGDVGWQAQCCYKLDSRVDSLLGVAIAGDESFANFIGVMLESELHFSGVSKFQQTRFGRDSRVRVTGVDST